MAETLLSVSEVLLFGRVMTDMMITFSSPTRSIDPSDQCSVPPRPGRRAGLNAMLEDQLSVGAEPRTGVDPGDAANFTPRFARIYGFSYEGGYYDLDAPIIMVVHGPGIPAESTASDTRASRAPDTPDRTGVAAAEHSFADDIHVWSYDKADFSIRLDTLSGTIEDILLDIEIGAGMGPVSGGKVAGGKVAGGKVAGGKVAGGKVAGGKVAGGKVAGGKVAGGKVSGD